MAGSLRGMDPETAFFPERSVALSLSFTRRSWWPLRWHGEGAPRGPCP